MSIVRPTYYVYFVTGASLGRILYIGVTSNLVTRIEAHRCGSADGFTARYRLWKLVHVEAFTYVRDAISREKQLKVWKRERKIALIDSVNPDWVELDARSALGRRRLPTW